MNRREFLQSSALLSSAAGLAQGETPLMRAGFAERDITPEIGMEQPGGYGKVYHKSFHDACKARAAVFDDGTRRVALVGLDAISVPRPLVLAARREIEQRCGLPGNAVLIGASHSHSSGPLDGVLPGQYDHASPLVRKLAYEHSTCADPKYLERVQAQIVDAVCSAYDSRAEARCGVGSGTEDRVAFNRRFRMKNGLSYTHPGQGNPDIIGPAGPTDPEVGIIGSWDKQGRLTGCIVNFACHATTSPQGISANWIHYLEKTIRGAMGADVIVVFLQGTSGDVTQVDNLSPYAHPNGERWAQIVGGRVGAEAVKVLLSMYPGSLAPVDSVSRVLRIERRRPSAEHVRRSLELVQKDPKEVGVTEWTFAKEIVMLDARLVKEPVADVEVQTVQVGPAVFISNPAELFCQYGLNLKKAKAFPFTFPVELANGQVGYVPTEEALGPHGGGYETRLTSYTNLEVSAGSQMVAAGLELARRMKPGALPEPPKPPAFNPDPKGIGSHPWSYGNLPPQLS